MRSALTVTLGAVLFLEPMQTLLSDWWNDPDAAHGLLLAPLAVVFAWKAREDQVAPAHTLGIVVLFTAVGLRYVSGLAAEMFTLRLSMILAMIGLVLWYRGLAQLKKWWLPATLLVFSIPLPDLVLSRIALPLQLIASQMGASLLEWRDIPVVLAGNVIHLPGRSLFVTEACSGLRSLTSLLALGILMGGLFLRLPRSRIVLIALTIPVAIALNGFRVFLTGFLVVFVAPEAGEGFMHMSEGWAIFVVAFAMLYVISVGLGRLEGPAPTSHEVPR